MHLDVKSIIINFVTTRDYFVCHNLYKMLLEKKTNAPLPNNMRISLTFDLDL